MSDDEEEYNETGRLSQQARRGDMDTFDMESSDKEYDASAANAHPALLRTPHSPHRCRDARRAQRRAPRAPGCDTD